MNGEPVTVIVQTRVRPGEEDRFRAWQARMGAVTAEQPGFLDQSMLPPNPPVQTDWVILQRFATMPAAAAWLGSERRLALLTEAQPLLLGLDDVHLATGTGATAMPAPVAAVFSTRLKPGGEAAFRAWQQRVASAQAASPGFQGYRFEQPIAGVQDDWVSILRFDTEPHLQDWLNSPARAGLLTESDAFTASYDTKVVRTAFKQWFEPDAPRSPAAWKQNVIVVSLLYPTVFLFGMFVQTPVFMKGLGLPFWFALFLANIAGVLILNELVPRMSGLMGWWLTPKGAATRNDLAGAALMLAICAAWWLLFWRLSQ